MYFHTLETFEDWNLHVQVLEKKLGGLSQDIIKALKIVEKYHDQPKRLTVGNYNRHPLRVARILAEEVSLNDHDAILIALCHDLKEWSDYDILDLEKEFSEDVLSGVNVLTWNQEGEWSDFVNKIVDSDIPNLVTIKLADKLDNNRSLALTGGDSDKELAIQKTESTMLPLVVKYCPVLLGSYNEVLIRLRDKTIKY